MAMWRFFLLRINGFKRILRIELRIWMMMLIHPMGETMHLYNSLKIREIREIRGF